MKKFLLAFAACSILVASCKKDEPTAGTTTNNDVSTFSELQVPSTFKFETQQNVQLDLSVTNQGFTTKYKIKIYDKMPSVGGNLIYSGFTTNNVLQTEFTCPSFLSTVYVVKEDPTGSSTYEVADITSGSIIHSFGKKANKGKTNTPSPDCSSGCDVSYNNHSSNVTINGNDPGSVFCFTGTFNGNINVNKGDKIAFVGKNSNAISALFKTLIGEIEADAGEIKWGQTITPAYMPNDNDDYFNGDDNLVDWLRQYSDEKDEVFIRGFLGKMLFTGEEVFKKSNVLSGGEKVRCMLSKVMLLSGNVLILDEPTSGLDARSTAEMMNLLGRLHKQGRTIINRANFDHLQTLAAFILEECCSEAGPQS